MKMKNKIKSTINDLDTSGSRDLYSLSVCWYNNDQFRLKLKLECWNHQDVEKSTWSTA